MFNLSGMLKGQCVDDNVTAAAEEQQPSGIDEQKPEATGSPANTDQNPSSDEGGKPDEQKDDYAELKAALDKERALRKEKEREASEAKKLIAERDAQQAQAEEDRLAEQGEFKELYEGAKNKLDEAVAQLASLETLQAEVEQYRETVTATLAGRLKDAPEYVKELLEDRSPLDKIAYLDKYESAWKKRGTGLIETPAATGTQDISDEEKSRHVAMPGRDY